LQLNILLIISPNAQGNAILKSIQLFNNSQGCHGIYLFISSCSGKAARVLVANTAIITSAPESIVFRPLGNTGIMRVSLRAAHYLLQALGKY